MPKKWYYNTTIPEWYLTTPNFQYCDNLNSEKLFRLENILEGQYMLMFFQDKNKDNQISSGVISPYQPSEWFYYYPDTINIRSNWELELNEINLGKNY